MFFLNQGRVMVSQRIREAVHVRPATRHDQRVLPGEWLAFLLDHPLKTELPETIPEPGGLIAAREMELFNLGLLQ